MELVRWNPWKDMWPSKKYFSSIFDDVLYPVKDASSDEMWSWDPVVDIYDNQDRIVIKAEIPGVDKKNIAVDLNGRVLTLKGERSSDNEIKEDSYYRKERTYGKFERAFTIPMDVEPEKIKADYKDGVLSVEIPKPEAKKPKNITVH